jgi:hypothetical protein
MDGKMMNNTNITMRANISDLIYPKCSSDNNPLHAVPFNSTYVTVFVYNTTQEYAYIWCWTDFDSPTTLNGSIRISLKW